MSIGPIQWPPRPTAAILLCSIVLVSLVSMTAVPVGAQTDLPVTIDVPTRATVGEPVTVSGSVSTPDLMGGVESELTVRLSVDGRTVSTKTVTLADGETTTVRFSHTFESPGTHTVGIEASINLAGQTFRNSHSSEIELSADEPAVPTSPGISSTPTFESTASTTIEGAAFTVPESLQSTVASTRDSLPTSAGTSAFVLATSEDLYLVFTDAQPRSGMATVEGTALGTEVTVQDVSFSLVAATDVRVDTEGEEVPLEVVAADPRAHRLDLVRIRATHRRIATRTDPDRSDVSVASSSGVLVNEPSSPGGLFEDPGGRARSLLLDSSEKLDRTTAVREGLLETGRPRLVTVGLEPAFWTDTESVVDGIVLTPGSEARQFLVGSGVIDGGGVPGDEPILYVVHTSIPSTEYKSVSGVKQEAVDGETVSVTANLVGQDISVQETLEHTTPCGTELAQIPTPGGPVCIDVVTDTLIHTGAAWTGVPESRDDVLLVVGLSSRALDSPTQSVRGEYRLVGEVVSTSRIDPRLPAGRLLVVADMEHLGGVDFDRLPRGQRSLVEDEAGALESRLLSQIEGASLADSDGSDPSRPSTAMEPESREGGSTAPGAAGSGGILSSAAEAVRGITNGLVDLLEGASGLFG